MRREIVVVDDMQYERSEIGLGRQLGRCPGVVRVEVDPQAGLADITYEESRVTPNRLRELIGQYGYTLTRPEPRPPARAGGPAAHLEKFELARQDQVA